MVCRLGTSDPKLSQWVVAPASSLLQPEKPRLLSVLQYANHLSADTLADLLEVIAWDRIVELHNDLAAGSFLPCASSLRPMRHFPMSNGHGTLQRVSRMQNYHQSAT